MWDMGNRLHNWIPAKKKHNWIFIIITNYKHHCKKTIISPEASIVWWREGIKKLNQVIWQKWQKHSIETHWSESLILQNWTLTVANWISNNTKDLCIWAYLLNFVLIYQLCYCWLPGGGFFSFFKRCKSKVSTIFCAKNLRNETPFFHHQPNDWQLLCLVHYLNNRWWEQGIMLRKLENEAWKSSNQRVG